MEYILKIQINLFLYDQNDNFFSYNGVNKVHDYLDKNIYIISK